MKCETCEWEVLCKLTKEAEKKKLHAGMSWQDDDIRIRFEKDIDKVLDDFCPIRLIVKETIESVATGLKTAMQNYAKVIGWTERPKVCDNCGEVLPYGITHFASDIGYECKPKCPTCGGTGEIPRTSEHEHQPVNCPDCGGTGKLKSGEDGKDDG